MVNQFKNLMNQFKEFWNKQEKKRRILIVSALGGILLVSIVATVLLNSNTGAYAALYTGLDTSESAQIYQMLKDMSVPAQIDSSGQILVRKEDKDMLLLELSALGYPKSAPSYDIFTSNAGLTTTEFEKKQYLLFQLQDRIEKTIMHIEGVNNAIVTLVVPEESSYVWQDEPEQKSTASILITMKPGAKLSSNMISAVKNLVASSVPKMSSDSVTLVDAVTSLEMKAEGEDTDQAYSTGRLDFETQMEQKIVEKAKNVLSLSYSEDKMRVSATVVIDYSKMITEDMQYKPEEDGNGVPSKVEESYEMDPADVASGVAGEQNNTDVPIYVDNNNDGIPETVYHVKNIDYFVSYVKKQIEKDNTTLVDASLAVSVADSSLTDAKRQNIVSLVSDATNVPETNITVVDLLAPEPAATDEPGATAQPIEETPAQAFSLQKYLPYLIAGAGVLFLLIIAFIVFAVLRRRKKAVKPKVKTKVRTEAEELEDAIAQSELDEADAQRRKLRDAALASVTRDNAVADEVKQFANENPEITASLIRAWLKEGE
jgi:flagellar basal-body M-ring protein/flagellar hook-basal body protein fliF